MWVVWPKMPESSDVKTNSRGPNRRRFDSSTGSCGDCCFGRTDRTSPIAARRACARASGPAIPSQRWIVEPGAKNERPCAQLGKRDVPCKLVVDRHPVRAEIRRHFRVDLIQDQEGLRIHEFLDGARGWGSGVPRRSDPGFDYDQNRRGTQHGLPELMQRIPVRIDLERRGEG